MKHTVYCWKCGWEGTNDELGVLQVDAVDEDGNWIDYPCCPQCGSLEGILPIEYKGGKSHVE